MASTSKQLAAIQSSDGNERLVVELSSRDGSVRLLQQTWSGRVGWFTQQSLTLQPEQIADLRGALGLAASIGRSSTRRPTADNATALRIISFPAAHAESA
ncbi:MAG: hypothetical protein HYS13_03615 [Planctomycetia bacterium]|nr:hypothetical protein [Planctomycetia bacterium]